MFSNWILNFLCTHCEKSALTTAMATVTLTATVRLECVAKTKTETETETAHKQAQADVHDDDGVGVSSNNNKKHGSATSMATATRASMMLCSADVDDDNVRLSSRVPFVHCGTIFWTPLCGAALSRVRCLCSAKAERTALAKLSKLLLLALQISMGSIKCIYNALKKARKLHSSGLAYDIPIYV